MKIQLTILSLFIAFISIKAQSFYDLNTIQKIEITFDQTNWDALMDAEKLGDENYIMAQSITINGETFDSIGVKYKGNSTYSPNQKKNPLHIELDTYKDHNYDGYTDIKLSNVAKDPSFLREVLSYQVLRQYMDAPLSNYANVYINGDLIGLFSNSESISKKFVNNRFGSKSNTFIKCNPVDGAGPQSSDLPNLVYLGQDSTDYYPAYEMKSDYGWQDLINLCDTLKNETGAIEEILDVDRALWMLAFDNIVVNLDSYIGAFAQNYYLYKDDYGRFIPVVWDLNESFGGFSMTGSGNLNSTSAKQQMSLLLNLNDSDFPLVKELLANPVYKRMYLAHCKTILLENFDNGTYFETGQILQELIKDDVLADINKFYTYNNFISNLTNDINSGGGPGGGSKVGIANLMNGRSSYLLNQANLNTTEPTIADITHSSDNPIINEPLYITASISEANTVYFGYKDKSRAPFTRVLMYDDGLHNDGESNDGIYGVAITLISSKTEYYIYAENDNIGKFSPVRAEYEYYQIEAESPEPEVGELVINELLASNDATNTDSDGEYEDWIELYNNSNAPIDLSGYYLSDDLSDLTQWTFPTSTVINAEDYLIIWADNDEEQEGLHCNFKLSAGGETLYLSNKDGVLINEVSFSDQESDISYGRYPNGTGDFQTMTPTFNAMNSIISSNDDIIIENNIKIYPNPATNNIMINVSDDDSHLISIFALDGRRMYKSIVNNYTTIDVSEWSSGLYFVQSEKGVIKLAIK
jgi:hypothetical protein